MDPTNDGANPLPDVQAPPAPAEPAPQGAPADDRSGAATNVPNADLAARIERASTAAVPQHLAEQPAPRKRGQRGPDRAPRSRPSRANGVPLAPLDALPDPSLLADHQATPLVPFPMDLPPAPAPFDKDTAEEMASFATEFLNDMAALGMETWATKHLGDTQLAAEAAGKARMTDKLRERWEKSLVKLAEKHRIALEMAPEIIAGGCLLLWGSNLRKQAVAIKVQGEQLRQPQQQAA